MCNRRASRAVCDFCSSRPAASSIDSRCFEESKTSLAFLPKACGMGRVGQCSNFQTAVPTFLDVCKSDVHTRFPNRSLEKLGGEESRPELTYCDHSDILKQKSAVGDRHIWRSSCSCPVLLELSAEHLLFSQVGHPVTLRNVS